MKAFLILLIALRLFGQDVKYQKQIDTSHFKTQSIGKSSFVKKVLYDKKTSRLLIKLNKTWYMYCHVKDVCVWQREDINASMVYLKFYKGKKELFCP